MEWKQRFGPITIHTCFFYHVLLILLSFQPSKISADIHGRISGWHISRHQDSSHKHQPHILLVITFPWSGDARSLSEEVTRLVNGRREEFGGVTLNIKHKNNWKIMEGVVGTIDEVLYHHYFSHKYSSRLQALDVLLSAQYLLSLPPAEHQAKSMSSLNELVKFAESGEEDVVFIEGWTFRNMTNNNNGGAGFSMGLTSLTSAEGRHRHIGGRMLLQQKNGCPIDMEGLNYTMVTSKCKGPEYKSSVCCGALKELACPVAQYIDDVTSECATILFSYLNLYGNYPPGLFANQCVEPNKQGLYCGNLPDPSSSSSHIFYHPLFPHLLFFSSLLFHYF